MSKRKQPDSKSDSLSEHERKLYDAIRGKQDMGIWTRDLKRETNLPDNVVNKSLKSLQAKNMIKEVVNIQNKGRKHFMAVEFEPSKEITGGAWYVDGNLDTSFIKELKNVCIRLINGQKVATLEGVADVIRNKVAQVPLTKPQVEEILKSLVLDNEVMEVRSTGTGEFASIPVGRVCYKCKSVSSTGGEPKIGTLSSIPCGVCPMLSQCTPDGIISPVTCVYYKKWLDF